MRPLILALGLSYPVLVAAILFPLSLLLLPIAWWKRATWRAWLQRPRERRAFFLGVALAGAQLIGLGFLEANLPETYTTCDLAEIEEGQVKSVPRDVRFAGPLLALYSLGRQDYKKNSRIRTGWNYPIVSRRHPAYAELKQGRPAPPTSLPVWVHGDQHLEKAGVAELPELYCRGTDARYEEEELNELRGAGASPRFYFVGLSSTLEDNPLSSRWFYSGCALVAVGTAMWLGSLLKGTFK